MKEFQKNVINEATYLANKIKELVDFTNTYEFNSINDSDKMLMKNQIFYMKEYFKTLKERIKNF
jgi:hypothetical protein